MKSTTSDGMIAWDCTFIPPCVSISWSSKEAQGLLCRSIPVAARSKACVYIRSLAGIASSNPAGVGDVFLL